jgi:hypothetical protein
MSAVEMENNRLTETQLLRSKAAEGDSVGSAIY